MLLLIANHPRAASQGQNSHADIQRDTHIASIGALGGGIGGLGRGRGAVGSGLDIVAGVAGTAIAEIVAGLFHDLATGAGLPVIVSVMPPVTGGNMGVSQHGNTGVLSLAANGASTGLRAFLGLGGFLGDDPLTPCVAESGNLVIRVGVAASCAGVSRVALFGAGGSSYSSSFKNIFAGRPLRTAFGVSLSPENGGADFSAILFS